MHNQAKLVRQKGLSPILIILIVLIIAAIGFVVFKSMPSKTTTPTAGSTPTASPTTSVASTQVYTNQKYNYSIQYPTDWSVRQYPDTGTGAAFYPTAGGDSVGAEPITINFMEKPGSQTATTFDNYVKIAATQEIQGYQNLISNNKITTNSGVVGYTTTWNTITSPTSTTTAPSLPITYFPPKTGSDGTIQVTLQNKDYEDTYNQMLPTFSYTN